MKHRAEVTLCISSIHSSAQSRSPPALPGPDLGTHRWRNSWKTIRLGKPCRQMRMPSSTPLHRSCSSTRNASSLPDCKGQRGQWIPGARTHGAAKPQTSYLDDPPGQATRVPTEAPRESSAEGRAAKQCSLSGFSSLCFGTGCLMISLVLDDTSIAWLELGAPSSSPPLPHFLSHQQFDWF